MARGPTPTSNTLNQQFVFINKDAKSKSLTSSHGSEKQTIYGHVRRHMVRPHLQDEQQDFENVFTPAQSIADRTKRRKSSKQAKANSKVLDRNPVPEPLEIVAQTPELPTWELQDQELVDLTFGFDSSLGIVKELATTPYARSYHYFRQMTIAEATGFSDVQFWNTSLQLSNSHESIFHALSSLGALYESLISIDDTSRKDAYCTSLVHCNQAIKVTVQDPSRMPLPLLLMSCVVFATIQIFADAPMAQRTLASGLNLASAARQNGIRFSRSQEAILDMATKMMQRYQNRLTLVLGPMTVVRDHLVDDDSPEPMPIIPAMFESLLEARENLQRICDWSFRLKKDAETLPQADFLQYQWLSAVDRFSQISGLHPLSTRSLNLLKTGRLASACLIAAQFFTHAIDFESCFPAFRSLLDLYHDDFFKTRDRTVFIDVFDIHDTITEILAKADREGVSLPPRQADQPTVTTNGEAWSQFFFGSSNESEKNTTSVAPESTNNKGLQIQSLEFFARTGMARIRLKPILPDGQSATIERWFSLLDRNRELHSPIPAFPAGGQRPVRLSALSTTT